VREDTKPFCTQTHRLAKHQITNALLEVDESQCWRRRTSNGYRGFRVFCHSHFHTNAYAQAHALLRAATQEKRYP